MSDLIIETRRESAAVLQFNRPDKRNALSTEILIELNERLVRLELSLTLRFCELGQTGADVVQSFIDSVTQGINIITINRSITQTTYFDADRVA